jgi:hypothetical protein
VHLALPALPVRQAARGAVVEAGGPAAGGGVRGVDVGELAALVGAGVAAAARVGVRTGVAPAVTTDAVRSATAAS